ncbi:MAG TPA: MBL fold metallo-hydrolase [Rhodobacteraceae bacterium]|jgi:glyoxylase-like metal-dependent hydrolase (beta-lactamase superfamily II)|nr:MBL fold metallo-hydrolase [Paracoccaceae bacterium]
MTMDAEFNPPVGVAETLAPGLRRILAPNPSPMTWRGTNTYIIGQGHVALIDPGPDSPAHLQAILTATRGETINAILVTHSHTDHSPLARPLAKISGAPVLAYGDSQAGRSQIMRKLVAAGMTGGGEGIDADFKPDQILRDSETIHGPDWCLKALWTPGHMANHLCFAWNDVLFTGDHVMGWASSLVSPPDGDLTQFMASCARIKLRKDRVYHAGHGAPVMDPAKRIKWLISHRLKRESQILAQMDGKESTARSLTAQIYTDIPAALMPAAERNVFAHLIDLASRGLIAADQPLYLGSKFSQL